MSSSIRIVKPPIIKTTHEWFNLIVAGDFHLGQKATDETSLKNMIDWLATKDKKTYGMVLTGDIIENVIIGSKGSPFEMVHPNPKDQLDIALELLEPVKDYILLMCDGNHENRTEKVTGISPLKILAKDLGVPFHGYRSMLKLGLKRPKKKVVYYNIYVEHGCGSIPKKIGGRYTKLADISNTIEADVYIKGHIHHKLVFPRTVWRNIGEKMSTVKIMYASNGSYLIDPDYAVRSGFEPTEPGVTKIYLKTDERNIHGSV